ncbi:MULTISPECIES: glycoside hydrolase family 43 protein [Sphingobium]|jgi:GH43 family beta-xylosidase|uniref:Alpha-L-arabinofuranosidase II n=2 Tax=Sphingobium fuliginis (strain ATCC 27551) TaxID=336203 RepID=A0A292ZFW4_SPHSA|nr:MULTISPECIES: glycoside hydrolase family 43 protein [Sphingobium]QOT70331.1 glycoside hydrolase family 43 protein [Sphingobium fuliginis]GAY21988.1 alpha-L-arabinofuranosidase II precursor [Sphingobium fuliginis]
MNPIDRRLFLAGTAALSATPLIARTKAEVPAPAPLNPLVKQRADAQVFRHEDGHYYLTGSVPEYDRLVLRRSKTLAGLATAEEAVLWRHEKTGPLSGFIWAPELHQIDGRWTMYFAAGPSGGGEDVFRIRTYAIVCDGPDPMTGRWKLLGQFQAPWDSFNLDSTSFVHKGRRYFAWAQREPGIETNSNLYIAPLASPLKLAARATRLTIPTLDWETGGYKVAEAPAVLHRNGRLFMTYSASATDARYCLGLLTASEDADIMDPDAWVKSQQPVFTSCRETSVYGPGHNSFTVDEKGRDILVYHGRDYEAIKGDPLFNPDRHTRVQRLYYKADGTPDFGVPVGNGQLPERFASAVDPRALLAHDGTRLIAGNPSLPATQFRQTAGRAGPQSIMLSPILLPDHYLLAGKDGSVTLARDDRSADFAMRSQFVRFSDDRSNTVRFVSIAVTGKALAAVGKEIRLAGSRDATARWIAD